MSFDKEQLRKDVAGFSGRFFNDWERGDLAYVASACEAKQCNCPASYNADGDIDCSVSIADIHDEHIADPIARMLNACRDALERIEELEAEVKRITVDLDKARDQRNELVAQVHANERPVRTQLRLARAEVDRMRPVFDIAVRAWFAAPPPYAGQVDIELHEAVCRVLAIDSARKAKP